MHITYKLYNNGENKGQIARLLKLVQNKAKCEILLLSNIYFFEFFCKLRGTQLNS